MTESKTFNTFYTFCLRIFSMNFILENYLLLHGEVLDENDNYSQIDNELYSRNNFNTL